MPTPPLGRPCPPAVFQPRMQCVLWLLLRLGECAAFCIQQRRQEWNTKTCFEPCPGVIIVTWLGGGGGGGGRVDATEMYPNFCFQFGRIPQEKTLSAGYPIPYSTVVLVSLNPVLRIRMKIIRIRRQDFASSDPDSSKRKKRKAVSLY